MINGIYAAVLGSRMESLRLDVVANNIANADTPGFKADYPIFKTNYAYLSDNAYDGYRQAMKDVRSFYNSKSSMQPGPIHYTGRKGDVAIDGSGFFTVQSPQGEAYTRAGDFRTNVEGTITTAGGMPVLGEGGPITVDAGQEFTVGQDGTVYVGTEAVDKLRVADFDPSSLTKIGSNLFIKQAGAAERPDPEYTILGESLESSNVNVVRQMASMVTAGRQFEAYQKAIKLLDDTNSRSSNSLGKI
jgi:flagellar basal-body rod protein FlgF